MRRFFLILPFLAAILAGCASNRPEWSQPIDQHCLLRGPNIPGAHKGLLIDYTSPPQLFGSPQSTSGAYRACFVHRSPTLIQVNCEGKVLAGVAPLPRWSGSKLVFQLPSDLRLADGTYLSAHDVARTWASAIMLGAGVDSVRALDSRTLEVSLERPDLRILASPSLGILSMTSHKAASSVGLNDDIKFGSRTWPVDPRDMIDAGSEATDLWIDRSPAVAEYARQRGMVVSPLPYDETYVLLVPPRAMLPVAAGHAVREALLGDLAQAARDASVRPSATPAWWKYDLAGCGPLSATPQGMNDAVPLPSGPLVIYYSDPVAGDLAARMVALAAMDTTASAAARDLLRSMPGLRGRVLTARELPWRDLSKRLERGDGFAFIVNIRNPVPDSCGAARELLRYAPWLLSGDAWLADTVIPLLDARSFVILTSRNIAVTWDIYGTVRMYYQPPDPEQP